MVAPDHPWAARDRLDPARLADSDWVLREAGSGTRSAFEHALAELGSGIAGLPVAMELPSNEAVRAAVEAGVGATAISATVAAPSLEAGLLHQVSLPLATRAFHLLRLARGQPTRAAAALIESLGGPAPTRRPPQP